MVKVSAHARRELGGQVLREVARIAFLYPRREPPRKPAPVPDERKQKTSLIRIMIKTTQSHLYPAILPSNSPETSATIGTSAKI